MVVPRIEKTDQRQIYNELQRKWEPSMGRRRPHGAFAIRAVWFDALSCQKNVSS